jgi:hypothetical protein
MEAFRIVAAKAACNSKYKYTSVFCEVVVIVLDIKSPIQTKSSDHRQILNEAGSLK